jgi:uncharacterized protein with FMN-binding domain
MSTDARASQWMKSNLAAIGSAAVLTVYAAGYARTKDAADRLAEESERRRPNARPVPSTSTGQVVAVEPRPIQRTPEKTTDSAPVEKAAPAPSAPARSEKVVAQASTADVSAPASTVAAAPSAPISSAAPAPQPTAPQPTAPAPAGSTTAAAIVPGTMAPPADAPPIGSSTSAANAQTRSTDTDAPRSGYRDGMFSGWGTSRHGDIQAYVEIKGGKITSAFISECLTQYSCSWIIKLPPQAVERQSAEIDYVSGATQSSNALYYALVDALKKAK